MHVVLLQHREVSLVRLRPVWLTNHPSSQCFDTVGLVIRPVKTVGRITYIVLVQTLNHAQSINLLKDEDPPVCVLCTSLLTVERTDQVG